MTSKLKVPKLPIKNFKGEEHARSCERESCLVGAFSHANLLQPSVPHHLSITQARWIIREFVRHNRVFRKMFPDLAYELEQVLGDCRSENCKLVLDLGCGSSSPLKFLSGNSHSVGVDVFQPSIEKSIRKEIHGKYFLMDVRYIDGTFRPKSFDCVVALQLIEHLEKDEGIRLIGMMETIARKKVVIFTPNGFLARKESEGNVWMVHKSGWTVEEMRKRGYAVVGLNGWKQLRGEREAFRYSPEMFWSLVSRLTQLFVRNRPENAFAILCEKNLE